MRKYTNKDVRVIAGPSAIVVHTRHNREHDDMHQRVREERRQERREWLSGGPTPFSNRVNIEGNLARRTCEEENRGKRARRAKSNELSFNGMFWFSRVAIHSSLPRLSRVIPTGERGTFWSIQPSSSSSQEWGLCGVQQHQNTSRERSRKSRRQRGGHYVNAVSRVHKGESPSNAHLVIFLCSCSPHLLQLLPVVLSFILSANLFMHKISRTEQRIKRTESRQLNLTRRRWSATVSTLRVSIVMNKKVLQGLEHIQ